VADYRNEDQALIGLARQLSDAYGEAPTPEDQDYAREAIDDYLDEYGGDAPSEALIALLDLESTDETFPLVDRAKTLLSARGPAVVEPLLAATLGRVYDRDGQTPENALGALDSMEDADLIQGLCEVLSGPVDDDLKSAAVDGLVALGEPVAHDDCMRAALQDPDAGTWARAVVEQLGQDGSDQAELETTDDAGYDDASEDEEEIADGEAASDDADAAAEAEADADDAGGDVAGVANEAADEADEGVDGEAGPAGEAAPAIPDQQAVDQSYEDFLQRFAGQRADGGGSQT
jgi:hypothetical protein